MIPAVLVSAHGACFEIIEWYNPRKIFERLPGAVRKLQQG
jgi:hypothetical protein